MGRSRRTEDRRTDGRKAGEIISKVNMPLMKDRLYVFFPFPKVYEILLFHKLHYTGTNSAL